MLEQWGDVSVKCNSVTRRRCWIYVVSQLYSGQFWTGVKARELGLVDGLGTMHDMLTDRFGDELEIVAVQPKRQFFSFSGPAGEAVGRAGADHLVAHLEERNYWQRYGL